LDFDFNARARFGGGSDGEESDSERFRDRMGGMAMPKGLRYRVICRYLEIVCPE
jgi:hypothetical protein